MNLIFVELAVLVLLLSFLLERNNDEADEDVDHKEGDDDDVNKVENGDSWTVVRHRTVILGVRVDASMHQSSRQTKRFLVTFFVKPTSTQLRCQKSCVIKK